MSIAAGIAVFFYMMRQPERNQEMISALNASIWSGSWFVSMQLFAWMRQMEYRYVTIFLITVVYLYQRDSAY